MQCLKLLGFKIGSREREKEKELACVDVLSGK